MTNCLICDRIKLILKGKNPNFVKELETGYVVLGDYQYFKGYTLFLSKVHKKELHELENNTLNKFLTEMAQVAKAVYFTFHPDKLNYELLGNGDPHMHWHIFPRYKADPNFKSPVWVVDKTIRYSKKTKPTNSEITRMKGKLLKYL